MALLACSFAVAERAEAQAAQAAPAPTAAPVVLGQVVHQVSQTVQTAGTQVATVQVQPTNLAAPVAVQSPGTTTAIAQTNAAGAGASSANSSSTRQTAGQSQGGGAAPASPGAGNAAGQAQQPASGGPAQASGQASQTAQNAGAQATTVQVQPVNIAIPITIGSPGSSIVIIQTNGASSGAAASNSSSTSQASDQTATRPAAPPGQPGTAAPPLSPPTAVVPGSVDFGSVLVPTGSGTTWIWNWVWNWTIPIPSVQLPAVPPWMLPGDEARPPAPARTEKRKPAPARDALPVANVDGVAPAPPAAAPKTVQPDSSRIVQRPTSASEPALEPFVLLPLPTQPALSAGGGFVPAGLLVGALALLALYLGSLGLLFGRLSLASAPWQHQAYLAPLQRPG
ncbi:MAG: hypothetical protein ACRDNI_07935 [Gaiellaceae bacterium]